MPSELPSAPQAAVSRWQAAFDRLRAIHFPKQAALVEALCAALGLKASTVGPEISRLRQGDREPVGRWIEAPARRIVFARILGVSADELLSTYQTAFDPEPVDPWTALVGPGVPRLPARFAAEDVVLDATGWADRLGRYPDRQVRIEVVGDDGSGREVATQQLREAIAGVENVGMEADAPENALSLEVQPWDGETLRRLAAHLAHRQEVVAALEAQANQADRAPGVLAPLLRPVSVLSWVRSLADGGETVHRSLPETWVGEQWRRAVARAPALESVGLEAIADFFAQWRQIPGSRPGWPPLRTSEVSDLLDAAVGRARREPWSAARAEVLIEAVESAPKGRQKCALDDLRSYLLATGVACRSWLEDAGWLREAAQGWLPDDTALATALAARHLAKRDLPEGLLDPGLLDLAEWLGLEGIGVPRLAETIETAPLGRRHLAMQAAAAVLAADPAIEGEADQQAAVPIWAGALVGIVRGIGWGFRPGFIRIRMDEQTERLVTLLQQLSQRGRGWLPVLEGPDLLADLEALAPSWLLHAAAAWEQGLAPADAAETERAVRILAPWQCDPLTDTDLEHHQEEDSAARSLQVLLWRAEHGCERANRVLAGLEPMPWGIQAWATRDLERLPLGRWATALLALPEDTEGLQDKRMAFVRSATRASFGRAGLELEALLSVARKLTPERLRSWLRAALLHEAFGTSDLWRVHELEGASDDWPALAVGGELRTLTECLPDPVLLEEIAGLPEALLADERRWPVLRSDLWTLPKSWPLFQREILDQLAKPLVALDDLAAWAALALHGLGRPEPLRERWRMPMKVPSGFRRHLQFCVLLAWARAVDSDILRLVVPSEAAREHLLALRARPGTRDEGALLHVGGRSRRRESLLEAVCAVVDDLEALQSVYLHTPGSVGTPPEPVLAWLARIAVEASPGGRGEGGRDLDDEAILARIGWYVRLQPSGQDCRQAKAFEALIAARDAEVIEALVQNLQQRDLRDWGFYGACRDAWRKEPAFAEACWHRGGREARVALVEDLLVEAGLPVVDQVRWALRAASLDVEKLGLTCLKKLEGEAILVLGLAWIEAASSLSERLYRALEVHRHSPWPAPLLPALLEWIASEEDPFSVADTPGAWIREKNMVDLLGLLAQRQSWPDGTLSTKVVKGLERLWALALHLPARRDRHEGNRFELRHGHPEALEGLAKALSAWDHPGPLLASWRKPPPPQPGDEAWGEEQQRDRPQVVLEVLAPPVLPLLPPGKLHELRRSHFAKEAVRELLRRGDATILDDAASRLRTNSRFDAGWFDEQTLGQDFPLPWYEALNHLCAARPDQLRTLFAGWLKRLPDQRLELLRALAGWASPPDPVAGAPELLSDELTRLFTD